MAAVIDAKITVGDRLFPLRFTGLRNADGALHTFTAPTLRMVSTDNVVKLAAGVCVSPAAGTVTYTPAAIDVDTKGIYKLQLTDTAGGLAFRWPTGPEWLLEIVEAI